MGAFGGGAFTGAGGGLPLSGGTLTGNVTMTGGVLTVRADEDVQTVLGKWASNTTTADVARWVHFDDKDAAAASAYGFACEGGGVVSVRHGTAGGSSFDIRRAGTTTWQFTGNASNVVPATDDAYDIGAASFAVRAVYANVIDHGNSGTPTLGFYGVAQVGQQSGIVNADGTLADITTKFNTLLGALEAYGLLAVA